MKRRLMQYHKIDMFLQYEICLDNVIIKVMKTNNNLKRITYRTRKNSIVEGLKSIIKATTVASTI
jgi:hypothetical protein